MARLTLRNIDESVVRALKQRAATNGRSAEAEHRDILRRVLLEEKEPKRSLAERAARLRGRFRSSMDSTGIIRADRDRDTFR